MGLSSKDFALLLRLKGEGYVPDRSSIIEIGAQQISNTLLRSHKLIERAQHLFARDRAFELAIPLETHVAHGRHEHQHADAPLARDLWAWLGFEYASIDIDGSPGSIPLDLNFDAVPSRHRGRYQVVTNFGTTEHVANQLNAFKIIHDLTAVGGVMLHNLPAQGMMNHGLVNYNPKFFWMLARSNGYKWLYMDLTTDAAYPLPQNIADYIIASEPEERERLESARFADCGLTVAVQKTFDIPFVAPLDVPTGATIDDPVMRRRYWTVLNPDALSNPKLLVARAGPGRTFKRALQKLRRRFSGG